MSTRKEPLAAAYVICGEDRAMVDRVVRALAARVGDDGGLPPERFSGDEDPVDDVVAACEALSLAGRRLVIVEDAEELRADAVAALCSYLEAPNPTSILALVSGRAPAAKLVSAVERVGAVYRYGPESDRRADRNRWLAEQARKEARRCGAELPAAVARRLVARVVEDRPQAHKLGLNALEIAREVEKLVAYSGEEPIAVGMVEALVPAHPDARSFQVADAIVAQEPQRAFALLQDLATGSDPQAPILVQRALARHFRALAVAQALETDDAHAVAEATGTSGYAARRIAEHAHALPAGAAERCVVRVAALELDLRVSAFAQLGRSPDDGGRLVLELATADLLRICAGDRAARPRAA